jgi:hypothetical protein
MDTMAGCFKQNLQKQLKRLEDATNWLERALNKFKITHNAVDAEIHDVNLNRSTNPPIPAATITPSCQRRPGPPSSVASSRRDLRGAQNEATQTACLTRDLIQQETATAAKQALEAAAALMEAARIAADNAIIATKAKMDGARVRQELDRRGF